MIDSGSSRSNVYLYEWPGEKENETGVVTEIMNCKVDGESLSQEQEEHFSAFVCRSFGFSGYVLKKIYYWKYSINNKLKCRI